MKNTFLIIASLILLICCKTEDDNALVFDQESFNSNRELWESSGISNYSFTQEYGSNIVGGQPKLVTVVNDNMLDTLYIQSNSDTDDSLESLIYYETIDSVYSYIDGIVERCEEELNSSESLMNSAKIEIEYNDSLYYPVKVTCTGYYSDDYVGGLSSVLNISDLEVK